jgi:hypothetical protein
MAQIQFIRPGEIVPFGISRYAQGHRLRLPVFAWVRRGYDIRNDQFMRGLWTFDVCLRTEQSGVSLHWGWAFIRAVERAA